MVARTHGAAPLIISCSSIHRAQGMSMGIAWYIASFEAGLKPIC